MDFVSLSAQLGNLLSSSVTNPEAACHAACVPYKENNQR